MPTNLITFNGKTMSLADWSRSLGLDRSSVGHRLAAGWTVEEALTRSPVGRGMPRPWRINKQTLRARVLEFVAANPGAKATAIVEATGHDKHRLSVLLNQYVKEEALFSFTLRARSHYFTTAKARDEAYAPAKAAADREAERIREARKAAARQRWIARWESSEEFREEKRRQQRERDARNAAERKAAKAWAQKPPKQAPVVALKPSPPKPPQQPRFQDLPARTPEGLQVQRLPGFTGDRWGIDSSKPVVGGFYSEWITKRGGAINGDRRV